MAEIIPQHLKRINRNGVDLVRHLYNRRSLWGTESMLYQRRHPMEWSSVEGSYQNWDIDTTSIIPSDATSPDGDPTRLFTSEDLAIWVSRRRASMPFYFRNCNADELHFVLKGQMTFDTDFGRLEVGDGDFVVIPKGITYRISMASEQDTLRFIYESGPELFLVPSEMIEHVYGAGRAPLDLDRLTYPVLQPARPDGSYQVRVRYDGAFSAFMGEMSTIAYTFDPLEAEIVDGYPHVFKFGLRDVEQLGTTPMPFIAGAYLDNKQNLAWALHMTAGVGTSAPVHRNPDVDELRIKATGRLMGNMEFTPQGVDHGYGRGYTVSERNLPAGPDEGGIRPSLYSMKSLKGTRECFEAARPGQF
jgi:homogentisate 1,2-dioxygenase